MPPQVQSFHGKWYFAEGGEWKGPYDSEEAARQAMEGRKEAQHVTWRDAKHFGGQAKVNIPGVTYGGTPKGLSIFLWGPSGTWKTTFAAGMPRPFFISVGAEGGDDSLDTFPRVAEHYNSRTTRTDVPPYLNWERPPSVEVKTRKQVEQTIQSLVQNFRQWNVATVVVDSLTFLTDMWFDEYLRWKYRTNPSYRSLVDESRGGLFTDMADFGLLNNWLRSLWVPLTSAGLNTVFTALETEVRKGVKQGETRLEAILPMLSGKGGSIKLPAAMKLHIHTVPETVFQGGQSMVRPVYYTAPHRHEVKFCRHRFFDAFPQGRLVDPEWPDLPTPRAVYMALKEHIYVGE